MPAALAQATTRPPLEYDARTHALRGPPMPLGGLGPLWALVDADRVAATAALPLAQRFRTCPRARYRVEVRT